MNKQEVIEALDSIVVDYNSPERMLEEQLMKVVEIAKRLDEPQHDITRKIPQIIAKYLELCKTDNFDFTEDYNLVSYDFINHFDTDLTIEEMEEIKMWFYDNDQKENQRRHILFLQAYTYGYEVEGSKWSVNEGDLVIRKGCHEAKVYFVECVDEDGILLVNGSKDEFFTDGPERTVDEETLSYFYNNFRLLVKKENLEVEKAEE